MDNKEIESLLNRIGTDIDTAAQNADTLYLECPEEWNEDASELLKMLATCSVKVWELLAKLPAPEEAPQADNIKDAIALLKTNGYKVEKDGQ